MENSSVGMRLVLLLRRVLLTLCLRVCSYFGLLEVHRMMHLDDACVGWPCTVGWWIWLLGCHHQGPLEGVISH